MICWHMDVKEVKRIVSNFRDSYFSHLCLYETGAFCPCEKLLSFVCVEVLRPSQPSGVMSSTVSLPNHTFTGQA